MKHSANTEAANQRVAMGILNVRTRDKQTNLLNRIIDDFFCNASCNIFVS